MTIPATVDLRETARRTWEVVVIGAGPAGAMAARELARRGCAVLLIDRCSFPRWKVCGCCLNGHALTTLREVGLSWLTERNRAVPVHGIRLTASGCVAEVPLAGGVSLSREVFDAALIRAAIETGVAFLPQTVASLAVLARSPDRASSPTAGLHGTRETCGQPRGAQQGGGTDFKSVLQSTRCLELRQGSICERLAARVVLVADGLSGNTAARIERNHIVAAPGGRIGVGAVAETASPYYAPGLILMACGRRGYLGLVRLEDGRLNLAAALDPQWVRELGGPGYAAEDLLAEAGWPTIPNLAELNWRGTPVLTRQARRRASERLFLLGDAAGYVEPFTGEGMAWALAAGRAVAPLAARAVAHWHPRWAWEWETIYRRLLGRRQRVCRTIAAVLRSPSLTRLAVHLLARMPALATPLTSYLGERKIGRTAGAVLSFPPRYI